MSTRPDPAAVLRRFLLSNRPVRAWTEGRIFANRLPESEAVHMPRRCAVLTEIPSPRAADYIPQATFQFDIKSYGVAGRQDFIEAKNVDAAIYQALHPARRGIYDGGLIQVASALNNGYPLLDPDTDWAYILRTYSVTMGETYVTA